MRQSARRVPSGAPITVPGKRQHLATCFRMARGLRLVRHSTSSGTWLSAVCSSYFIPPGSTRASWQGGDPLTPRALEKRSQRSREAGLPGSPGGEWPWGREMPGAGARRGFPKQVQVHGGAQDTGFGGGERAEAPTGIRPGGKHPLPTPRCPPLTLFPLLPEPEGPAATTHDRVPLSGLRTPTSDSARQPELAS